MCHCFDELTEMDEEERTELLEQHSMEELRAEYSGEELQSLGITA